MEAIFPTALVYAAIIYMTTQKVKLIILDIDGVMTDGKKYYNRRGDVEMKTFCDKDWTAIKRFIAIGIPVVFLTGDKTINEEVVKNRQLPIYFSRVNQITTPKENFVQEFSEIFKCDSSEMVYLGDDLFDIGIMKSVGHPYCPADSPAIVKKYSTEISACGGQNSVMVLFDTLEKENKIPFVSYDEIMNEIYKIDEREKF